MKITILGWSSKYNPHQCTFNMTLPRRSRFYILLLFLIAGIGEMLGQHTDSLYLVDPAQAVIELDPARDTTIRIEVGRSVMNNTCEDLGVKPVMNLTGGAAKLGFFTPEPISTYIGWRCDRKDKPLLIDIVFKGGNATTNGSLVLTKGGTTKASFNDLEISFQIKGAVPLPPKPSGDLKLIKNDGQAANTHAVVLRDELSKILSLRHVAEEDAEPLSLTYTFSEPDKASEYIRLSTSSGPLPESFRLKGGETLDIMVEKLKDETAQFALVINDEKRASNKIDVSVQLHGEPEPSSMPSNTIIWILLGLLVIAGLGFFFWKRRQATEDVQKVHKQVPTKEVASATSQEDYFVERNQAPPTSALKKDDQKIVNQAFLNAFVQKARNSQKGTNQLLNQITDQLKKEAKKSPGKSQGRRNQPRNIQSLKKSYSLDLVHSAIGTAKSYFKDVPKEDILFLNSQLKKESPAKIVQNILDPKRNFASTLTNPVLSTKFLQNLYQLDIQKVEGEKKDGQQSAGMVIKGKEKAKSQVADKKTESQSTSQSIAKKKAGEEPVRKEEENKTLSQITQVLTEAKRLLKGQNMVDAIKDLIGIADEWSSKRAEFNQLQHEKKAWEASKKSLEDEIRMKNAAIQTHLETIKKADAELTQLKGKYESLTDKEIKSQEYLTIFRQEHPMTWDRIQGLKSSGGTSVTNQNLMNYALNLHEFLNDALEDTALGQWENKFTTLTPIKHSIDESTKERLGFIEDIAITGKTVDKGLAAYLSEEENPEEGLKNYVEDRLYESINDQLIYLEELSHLDKFPIEIEENGRLEIQKWSKSRSREIRDKLKELTGIEVAEVELFQEFSKELENQCKWGTDQDKLDEIYKQIDLPKQKVKEIKKFGYTRGDTSEKSDVIIS